MVFRAKSLSIAIPQVALNLHRLLGRPEKAELMGRMGFFQKEATQQYNQRMSFQTDDDACNPFWCSATELAEWDIRWQWSGVRRTPAASKHRSYKRQQLD